MAELVGGAFLSSFFQVALEKLSSNDFIDYFRRGKLDDKLLQKLQVTLNSINHVLEEAETKQYQSSYVKKWLGDLKHVVYEADQLLDEIATYTPNKKLKVDSQPSTSKVFDFFSSCTDPFESRIKELLEKLEFLAKQKDMLGLKQEICASNEGEVGWKALKRLPSTSLVDESSIYGRDGDKEEVTKFLLSDIDAGDRVPIISIVGLGGMGKTTLAQLVYNNNMIQKQFELKAWVYVSETFNVVGLTKAILRSFHSSADGEDLNLLQHQLQQRLTGKKYLLVLDDVWNGSAECWERLLLPFNNGSTGSKIIVTTRDKEVASVMKSTKLLHLKQLKKSECWSMFVRHAFHGTNASEYPNLESIGKKIVEKCGGLPLAVKALGNLLRRKFSQREWVKILETDLWCLSEGESNINSVLRLSFHHLPSNLKRCFSYCSIFPRGYIFCKAELIKLWMAEGLLKCCRIDKTEEELGNEFFDDLESVSFFQRSGYVDYRYFVMHDLVNDLAKSVSGEFCLRIEGDWEQDIPERTRHIWCSLELKDGDKISQQIYQVKGLRSLMARAGYGGQRFRVCNTVQYDLLSRLKYLRMLSLRFCNLKKLADEISNLKLLRYLDLSRTGLTSLPDSICTLYNLETLILIHCPLTEFPLDFYKLVSLRHLILKGTHIKKMPEHIGRLHHLQTLTDFVVGDQKGSDINELAKLNHLQGTLRISGLENVIDRVDAVTANLQKKKDLDELHMMFSYGKEIDVFVLEALQPNINLNKLDIVGYCGNSFPNWIIDSHLPNLVSLKLIECKFCSRMPPLGQLCSLKELSISGCHGIESIGKEFYGNNSSNVAFRSLAILRFEKMSEWKDWLCVTGFPLLKELSIRYCPKLKRKLPQHLPSLQKLKISDCQELEASIPKADNIVELELKGCENILVNELPSTLKNVILCGSGIIESSLELILLNNTVLENLFVDDFNGTYPGWNSWNFRSCDSLRHISISRWRSFTFPFSLHLFTNLHSLKLEDCPMIESFPCDGLPSHLSILHIFRCPKLIASREKWGLFQLNSLKEFIVSDDFENMESFPEESLLPLTLDHLELRYCSKLRIMNYKGLLHLKSLQSLHIDGCLGLECLPEECLPNSLSILSINNCPILKQRYQKEEGKHWHKICHIPIVRIA
ncbi:putative P-loop containing nucleoside triphosphate hydrolase, leucine-rich repeat domain, L [Medicago truncatula]|uniref:Putative P-loop containing nucleoside triphosphate hydrolase, leucine-rich repeat domain, L n=1 Tax=Medicago truncatula TaxID=3880 RepID=A0A396ISA0_MEDTR|nr:putative disease resistance RPP13-like protein 1 [Medicago truncatula]RHN65817.1 putative P-loop containing nucleoside triphosphate hydrolase, leucine-rich repeat domain, L [Medicago truncatula]